uniref:Integrin alpha FG-GAP repeat containing 1 n=1 Tax=Ciona savignyi TaxID=51511 RepID=H2Y720_CIOSA
DLLVTLPNGTRQFWLGHLGPVTENWTFNPVSFSTSLPNYPVKSPHSNSFVDLSGDGAADLFITSVDSNNEAVFEIWKGTELELKLISNYSFSSLLLNHNIEVGQSVFADINGDGLQEHILPVCELQEKRCIHSMIFVYLDGDWIELFSGEDHLNFISSQTSFLNVPITPVLGDF